MANRHHKIVPWSVELDDNLLRHCARCIHLAVSFSRTDIEILFILYIQLDAKVSSNLIKFTTVCVLYSNRETATTVALYTIS